MKSSIDKTKEFCILYKESNLKTVKKIRGEKAEILFEAYLGGVAYEEWIKALQSYYIAMFFGNKFLRFERSRLISDYITAKELYYNRRYEEAIKIIEAFKDENNRIAHLPFLRDSLEFLYKKLEEETNTSANMQEDLKKESINRRLSISGNWGIKRYGWSTDQDIILQNVFYYDYIAAKPFPQTVQRFDIRADYHLSSTISMGICAEFESQRETQIGHFYLKPAPKDYTTVTQTAFSVGAAVKYFIRDKSGFRPFVSLALGVIHLKRSRIQFDPKNNYSQHYQSREAVAIVNPQLSAEAGTEFVFDKFNLIFLQAFLIFSNQFGDKAIVPHFNMGGGIGLGINIF